MSTILGLIPVILIILAVILLFTFVPIGLWISALAAGVKVGIFDLIGMRLRRVSPSK
ncbi:MAG: flotillin-like FloA family protein, partial [Firmicutes bacterium]|nr:flotillin-like FloA family protein [Bacillota bacterium]